MRHSFERLVENLVEGILQALRETPLDELLTELAPRGKTAKPRRPPAKKATSLSEPQATSAALKTPYYATLSVGEDGRFELRCGSKVWRSKRQRDLLLCAKRKGLKVDIRLASAA